jgi:hypothetical protein
LEWRFRRFIIQLKQELIDQEARFVNKTFTVQRVGVALFIFNLAGAVVYLVRASLGWRNPAEHGMIPVSGEPFVWFAAILPVLVVYPLLNLVWGAFIVFRRRRQSGRWWLLTATIWFCAVVIDFVHH